MYTKEKSKYKMLTVRKKEREEKEYRSNTTYEKEKKLRKEKEVERMFKEIERDVESIPQLSEKSKKRGKRISLEELITTKPRVSIKEINATYRLIKMIESKEKYEYYKKEKTRK